MAPLLIQQSGLHLNDARAISIGFLTGRSDERAGHCILLILYGHISTCINITENEQ